MTQFLSLTTILGVVSIVLLVGFHQGVSADAMVAPAVSTGAPAVTTVFVGGSPTGIAYDGSNGDLFVPCTENPGFVAVVNPTSGTVIDRIPLKEAPFSAGFDPSNGEVYVLGSGAGVVSAINASSNDVVATISVQFEPSGIAYDTANRGIYVATLGTNNVTEINGTTNAVSRIIPVGLAPDGIAFDPSNGYLYVPNELSEAYPVESPWNVTVIDGASNSVVGSVPVVAAASSLAYDAADADVYAISFDVISVIAGTPGTVSDTIELPFAAGAIAYSPGDGHLWVTNGDRVTAIDPATLAVGSSVTVGSAPVAIAVDASNDRLFLAEMNGNVSVISFPSYAKGPFGLPSWTAYVFVGAVGIGVIAAAVFLWTRRKPRSTSAPYPPGS